MRAFSSRRECRPQQERGRSIAAGLAAGAIAGAIVVIGATAWLIAASPVPVRPAIIITTGAAR